MCAGISIAKPHFPFSQSYHMAEELMQNTKEVKKQFGKDYISLDFHIAGPKTPTRRPRPGGPAAGSVVVLPAQRVGSTHDGAAVRVARDGPFRSVS